MAYLIVHNDPITGIMAYTIPAMNLPRLPGETELQLVHRIAHKDVPKDGRAFRVIDNSELPDQTGMDYLRNAWVDMGNSIVIDMAKARILHQRMLLAKRDELLMSATVDAVLGDGAAKEKFQQLKNLDRILPIQLAAISDVATLRAFVPDALK